MCANAWPPWLLATTCALPSPLALALWLVLGLMFLLLFQIFNKQQAQEPERDYSDVNAGAQRLIVKVVLDNLDRTGLGRETLVFKNHQERQRPR